MLEIFGHKDCDAYGRIDQYVLKIGVWMSGRDRRCAMIQKIGRMCIVICLGFVVWQCGSSNPVNNTVIGLRMDDRGATPAGIDAVVQANNQFALDVYAELKQADGNVFLSPYSISTALAMTYEGANGQTAEEMAQVFYFPTDDDARRAAFAALHNALNEEDAEHELRVANALWAQKDYVFLETYTNTLQNFYAANASNLDFRGASEDARKTINTWVEAQTNDKIENLFPQGSLSASTRLVLTNAIYFKGDWLTQFDKNKTQNETFYLTSNTSASVPMMRLTDGVARFKYAEVDGGQILEMPYKGEKLSMIVLLPERGNLAHFESVFSLENLNRWKGQMHLQKVDVFLPKFTFKTKYLLNGTLQKMGMPTAFSNAADFSGMDGTQNLAIQVVVHQAFVDVNEEGTEAAAATGVGVELTSVPLPPPVFRADRPFLFMIQDVAHGNILFLGRVADPTK